MLNDNQTLEPGNYSVLYHQYSCITLDNCVFYQMAVKDFKQAMNAIDERVLRQLLTNRAEVLHTQLRLISSVNKNLNKTNFNATRSRENLHDDVQKASISDLGTESGFIK